MTLDLPRQTCRCGKAFGSLQAHLAHADYCEPLPHDHPADVGLVLLGGEWHVKSATTVSVAPAPVKAGGSKETKQPYVRTADSPSTDYERTCTVCGATFERPRKRGRPPTKCPECR